MSYTTTTTVDKDKDEDVTTFKGSEIIASLWSGFGTVVRHHNLSSWPSRTVIEKRVRPPRAPHTTSIARKIASYRNEMQFYSLCSKNGWPSSLRVPDAIEVKESQAEGNFSFFLTDLEPEYPRVVDVLDGDSLNAALIWLATFHGHFRTHTRSNIDEWPVAIHGNYWHLPTRLEELERIPSRPRLYRRLRRAAWPVHRLLSRGHKWRTIVHGDPKSENLMFGEDLKTCAAVDFQYAGIGYGAVDLAYLLISSTDSRERWRDHLTFYHSQLPESVRSLYPLTCLSVHFDLAVVDLARFLVGWGLWGDSDACLALADQTLAVVDSGQPLEESEYESRLEAKWGDYFV